MARILVGKVTVSVMCLLMMSFFAHGQGQKLQIVTEHHPPVQFLHDNQVKGFATEIMHMVLQEANLEAEIRVMPWARAYNKALTERNTLIYSMVRSKEREDLFIWLGPISQVNVAVIGLSSRDFGTLSTLEDTRRYVFGAVRNAYSHDYLLEHGFEDGQNIYLTATMQEQVDLLLKKKIDFLMTDPLTIGQHMLKLGLKPDHISSLMWIPELSKDLFLASSKKTDPAVVESLKIAMEKVSKTKAYQERYDLKSMKFYFQ